MKVCVIKMNYECRANNIFFSIIKQCKRKMRDCRTRLHFASDRLKRTHVLQPRSMTIGRGNFRICLAQKILFLRMYA